MLRIDSCALLRYDRSNAHFAFPVGCLEFEPLAKVFRCERRDHACQPPPVGVATAGSRLAKTAEFTHRMQTASGVAAQLKIPLSHGDEAVQKQRPGSLAATCIPPTADLALLGPRVEHLSATHDGTLLNIISHQLELPKVSLQNHSCQ